MRLALLAAFAFAFAIGQTQPLAFDVASVNPQKWTGTGGVGVFIRGNTLVGEHADLETLVEFAYNLKGFQVSGGPAWIRHGMLDDSELFQILAKPPAGETPTVDQFRQMLQTLLADRFHLQIRHVPKQLPAYSLVVAKGGPKLRETAGAKRAMITRPVRRVGLHIDATNVTIQDAVDSQLGLYADHPVFNRTGLTGHYDFSLEWLQDQTAPAAGTELQSYATALQDQLGLKLEPITAPFDTVVIDHVEHPSGN
ncbi:MAG TPA: TIGR03435 family protein [Bryobacteraceae bacterium]|nr:TIGR03435 family protein [Bryobacteraceae bacterium]